MISSNLADWLVLEVGYQHWRRMNVGRAPVRGYQGPEEFLQDIASRLGMRIVNDWKVWLRHGGTERVLTYLIKRLQPGRLALPDRYDLSTVRRA